MDVKNNALIFNPAYAAELAKHLPVADMPTPEVVAAPVPEPNPAVAPYQHPTRASHEESKTKRLMAKKSRKINRKK